MFFISLSPDFSVLYLHLNPHMMRNLFQNSGEDVQHGVRQTHEVQCKMGDLVTTGAGGRCAVKCGSAFDNLLVKLSYS